jgi:L-aminopeptidase/D-esterase-like protein
MYDDITDIPGIRVGHETNLEAGTGCTVVLCDRPAVGGVDVRGGAPATRETELLRPMHLVQQVHAILLSGGSAFGLEAAAGVMRYLEERGIGLETGVARVPIVAAAAIFDLAVGSASVRPNVRAGYRACEQASGGPLTQGTVGAGTGATIGKLFDPIHATKGGLGSASVELADGTLVGALVIVNAVGDVFDPSTGQLIAGEQYSPEKEPQRSHPFGNSTIAVVATNASLSKEWTNKVAQMAHDGLAQAIRPVHTLFDGDTIFALALGPEAQAPSDPTLTAVRVSTIGAAAANTLARAVVNAVRSATALHGIPAVKQKERV